MKNLTTTEKTMILNSFSKYIVPYCHKEGVKGFCTVASFAEKKAIEDLFNDLEKNSDLSLYTLTRIENAIKCLDSIITKTIYCRKKGRSANYSSHPLDQTLTHLHIEDHKNFLLSISQYNLYKTMDYHFTSEDFIKWERTSIFSDAWQELNRVYYSQLLSLDGGSYVLKFDIDKLQKIKNELQISLEVYDILCQIALSKKN